MYVRWELFLCRFAQMLRYGLIKAADTHSVALLDGILCMRACESVFVIGVESLHK